jgi:hypothetical protein
LRRAVTHHGSNAQRDRALISQNHLNRVYDFCKLG